MGGISGSLNNHDPLNMGGINVMNSNQSQTSSTPSPLNTTSEPIDFVLKRRIYFHHTVVLAQKQHKNLSLYVVAMYAQEFDGFVR